jgi:hypothetical protein
MSSTTNPTYDPATLPNVVVPAPKSDTKPPASPYNTNPSNGARTETVMPKEP